MPSHPPLPLAKPSFDSTELDAVREVLESGWVAGQGPAGARLEQAVCDLTGVDHSVAVANCTAALHLAMIVLGVSPGDEVVVADYTYPATGHAVMYAGGRPVFADVRSDTGTIDVADVEAAIGPRTVGIVGVDVAGQCADWDELKGLADRHGLFLVEDAACSVGAEYKGRQAGSLADIACFSLHARKGATSGEGGLLVTDDRQWAERARSLAVFGTRSAWDRAATPGFPIPTFQELGYNYKLSDIQAAVATAQLAKLPGFLEKRRSLADAYSKLLGEVEGVEAPLLGEDRTHTWQTYAVTLSPEHDRDLVGSHLREIGIGCNIGTFASHLQPVYEAARQCPVSARLFASQLALPLFTDMTVRDVEYVVDALERALAS